MENNNKFEYTYSAKQQQEIEKIKQKYMPKKEDKMELLRKLDKGVTKKGTVWSITLGVIGLLFFALGMNCTLVWADKLFVAGVVMGVAGMILMGAAYPVYKKITEKEREKVAAQILELADELSK